MGSEFLRENRIEYDINDLLARSDTSGALEHKSSRGIRVVFGNWHIIYISRKPGELR
jgi:hypothetical protein